MNLGYSLIVVALVGSLASFLCYVIVSLGQERLRMLARQFYVASSISVIAISAVLMRFMVTDRFDIRYVYEYSAKAQPTLFKYSGFWGGQEGSWLLWLTWIAIVGLFLFGRARHFEAPAMAFWSSLQVFFLIILIQRNPFQSSVAPGTPFPTDGSGLTPLLQNYWMAIHPPILFCGFTLMSVPAAFAIAALIKKDFASWTRMVMGWTLLGWTVLGTGILIGGFWAYETLGWGGWWGWDPVENASLVPWLVGGALVHSLVLERVRNTWKTLNLSLAVAIFILVIYATFLTRSGVLGDFSVHSFASLGNNNWLVGFMLGYALLGIGLIGYRAFTGSIREASASESISTKEFLVFLGVVCFGLLGILVAVGMSSPILSKWVTGQAGNVPTDYYYRVTAPVALLMLGLVGFSPLYSWARDRGVPSEARKLAVSLSAGLGVTIAIALLAWRWRGIEVGARTAIGGFAICILLPGVWALIDTVRRKGLLRSGGYIAHVGLSVFFLGMIAATHNNRAEPQRLTLTEGKPVQMLGMSWTFAGLGETDAAGKEPFRILVEKPNGDMFLATPVMQAIRDGEMRHPYIRRSVAGDLYIAPVQVSVTNPAPHAIVGMKKPEKVGDYSVKFLGFTGMEMREDGVTAGARLQITDPRGKTSVVVPVVHQTEGGMKYDAAPIPGSKLSMLVTDLSVETQEVRAMLDGPAYRKNMALNATIEVTYKPIVWSLWLGVMIIAFGGGLSAARRIREARQAAEPLPQRTPVSQRVSTPSAKAGEPLPERG
ncbi:MAG: cytochrome c biogenesis protein CcsA [Armatimonadetes bacterium]|nr:cytochrome c biogenesis protein CcsA [Armatimonadota bacterium]